MLMAAERRKPGRPRTRPSQKKELTVTTAIPHEVAEEWNRYVQASGFSKIKIMRHLLTWYLRDCSTDEGERSAIRDFIERPAQRHETWLRERYTAALQGIIRRLTPVARADFADAMNDEPNERGSHANPGQRHHKDSRSHR
jgi:hypothetical protein